MPTVTPTILRLLKRRDVLACLALVVLFYGVPQLDLWASGLFFDGQRFPLVDVRLFHVIYRMFAKIHYFFLAGLSLGLLVLQFKRDARGRRWRKRLAFLLLALVIGPGLLVNVLLKDNSFGRPRPAEVQQFGGEAEFVPILTYSGYCPNNCSFASGHAAIAFFLIALGWVFDSRRLFGLGFAIGTLMSLIRIMQGGHFLSDTVFAFWVVYFTTLLLGRCFGYPSPLRRSEPPPQ